MNDYLIKAIDKDYGRVLYLHSDVGGGYPWSHHVPFVIHYEESEIPRLLQYMRRNFPRWNYIIRRRLLL